jgi:hypothetical protein
MDHHQWSDGKDIGTGPLQYCKRYEQSLWQMPDASYATHATETVKLT